MRQSQGFLNEFHFIWLLGVSRRCCFVDLQAGNKVRRRFQAVLLNKIFENIVT